MLNNIINKFVCKNCTSNNVQLDSNLLIIVVLLNFLTITLHSTFNLYSTIFYEIIVYSAYLIQIGTFVYYFNKRSFSFNKKNYKIFKFFSIYMFVQLIYKSYNIFINNANLLDVFDLITKYLTITIFIVCMFSCYINEEESNKFYKKYLFISFIVCVINLVTHIEMYEILYDYIMGKDNVTSYSINFDSVFSNRNTFALYLVTSILSFIYLFVNKIKLHNKYSNLIYFIVFITIFINLIFTFSRTSLGIVIFILFISLSLIISRKKFFTLILVIVTVTLIVLINFEGLRELLISLILRPETLLSFGGRSKLWIQGINDTLNLSPLLGLGRFTGIEFLNEYLKIMDLHTSHFHSVYVSTFVSLGVTGLIALISLLLYLIKNILTLKLDIKNKIVLLLIIFTFCMMYIFETTRFTMGNADISSVLFYFTVIILVTNGIEKKEKGI